MPRNILKTFNPYKLYELINKFTRRMLKRVNFIDNYV